MKELMESSYLSVMSNQNDKLREEIKHLQSVIDKANKYIENNKNKTMYSITGEDVDFEICLFESDIDELQEILRSKE